MPDLIKSKALERLVTDLRTAHGDNLASITLYGSSAAGDQPDSHSDYNVLVVVKKLGAQELRASQAATIAWVRAGQPPPVFFTLDELKGASDVFPIEFRQMEKARDVLYGTDPFELVEISHAHLRHQVEYELRTKFTQLRRLYLSQPSSVTNLSALMVDSFASFAALSRAVLILHGQEPPVHNADAVRATVSLLKLDASPFEWILARKAGKAPKSTESETETVFAAYLNQIELVIHAVDQISDDAGQ